ncbi:hypothetical protein, partial [Burkholderia gladioli]|uniref:hypothetical protein n=1 Tax=Burkholderia gladioli TaxID=28095 RepID=UPI0012F95058
NTVIDLSVPRIWEWPGRRGEIHGEIGRDITESPENKGLAHHRARLASIARDVEKTARPLPKVHFDA